MKKNFTTAILLLLLATVTSSYAQEANLSNKLGVGFHLKRNQQDFGVGLNLTSPYLVSDKIALRLKGNLMWNQSSSIINETTWIAYSNVSLGMVGVTGVVANCIRLYGEGGLVVLFPSSDLSEESMVLGGYGLFGFEFFMDTKNNYFIEIGGIGTGAVADRLVGEPIYSNGMLINVGFRHQF